MNTNKPATRRERILKMFNTPSTLLSCNEITKTIIADQKLTGSVAHYLSGSVSSILASLVKKGILKYAKEKTDRGGHIYQLK